MKPSSARAVFKILLSLGLIGVLLGPYMLLVVVAPKQRHHVSNIFFRATLLITGIRLNVWGQPGHNVSLFTANHGSYLDIPILGAAIGYGDFVAKSEVSDWPLFGFLARISKTLFISRNSVDAARQRVMLADRMNDGSTMILFPEGTSSNGADVMAFKSSLFEALNDLNRDAWVQPVTVIYARHRDGTPQTQDERELFTWYGDMTMAPHLWGVYGGKGCEVDVVFHEPLRAAEFSHRKKLAKLCETQISHALARTLEDGRRTLALNNPENVKNNPDQDPDITGEPVLVGE